MDYMTCFSSEPLVTEKGIFLGCFEDGESFMAQWSEGKFQNIAKSEEGRLFSHPLISQGKISWHEFDMAGVRSLYQVEKEGVKKTLLKNIGQASSFSPISADSWIYRTSDTPSLWLWSNGQATPFFTQNVEYIFSPYIDDQGGVVFKVREGGIAESAPDKLLYGKNKFEVLLEDRDSNPASPFKSFRHQLALSEGRVAVIATDDKSEVLLLLENGSYKEIARAGVEIKSFDYFSPKLKGDTLVFRGVDLENRKAVWVYKRGKLQRLLTQGDVVQTDLGVARIDYKDQDSILYGSPGVGPQGEIVQQATLTDADHPNTVLGIGLIRFIDR